MGYEEFLKLIGVKKEATEEQKKHAEYESALSEIRRLLMQAGRLPGTEKVVQTVNARILEAAKFAEADNHHKARLELGNSKAELIEAVRKGQEELQKQTLQREAENKKTLKDLRAREPLLGALSSARSGLLELQDLSGAEPQWRDLSLLIDQAEKLEAQGKYGEGLAVLKNAKALIEAGRKANQVRIREAREAFGPCWTKHDYVLNLLQNNGQWLPPDERKSLQDALAQAVAPLLLKTANRETGEQVLGELNGLQLEVPQVIQKANQAHGLAKTAFEDCQRALGELNPKVTPADRADLDDRLLRMHGWLEQCDYTRIEDAKAELIEDCSVLNRQVLEAEKAWAERSGTLKTLRSDCEEWVRIDSPVLKTATPTPKGLLERIDHLLKAPVGEHMGFAQAIALLEDIEKQHTALKERVTANAGLQEQIKSGELLVGAALKEARKQLTTLKEAANDSLRRKEQPLLDSCGDFGPRIEACVARWERNKQIALTDPDLEVGTIVQDLNKLADELSRFGRVDKSFNSDAFLELSAIEQAKARRAAYQKQRLAGSGAVEMLERIALLGSPRHAALLASLQALDRRVESAKAAAEIEGDMLSLKQLESELVVAFHEANERSYTLRDECDLIAVQITQSLEAFEEKLKQYSQSFLTESPQYEQYHKLLAGQYRELKGTLVLNERDVDLLEDLKRELLALKLRVPQAQQALEGIGLPEGAPTLEAVTRKITQGRSDLKIETLTAYLATTQGRLKQALDKIDGAKLSRGMDESLTALTLWQKDFNQALAQAGKARDDYQKFEIEAKLLKTRLGDAKKEFADQADYLKALLARLEKARTAGKPEGQLAAAQEDLKALKAEIEQALKDPAAMKSGQELVLAVELAKAREKEEWKGLYADFTDRVLPALKKVADPALYKEVAELGKIAQQTYAKSSDLEFASQQLAVARNRAEDVTAFPGGKALHFRKELGPAEVRWKEAVLAFQKQLDELVEQVGQAEASHREATAQAAQELKDLLQAGAFQRCVATMNNSASGPADLRAAREDGLRTLRRYRQAIGTQQRIVVLGSNPFMEFRALMELDGALYALEYNLLISV